MSDPITVVTHTGLGERLKSSCTGIIFGIILFLGSFPLLFCSPSPRPPLDDFSKRQT